MKRIWMSLTLLLAVSAAPVVGGWLLYFNPHWLPDTRANRGELIYPVVQLDEVTLSDLNGDDVVLRNPRGEWTMLLSAEQCGEMCRQELWKTRQVRWALGEGRTRLERLLVLGAPPSKEFEEWLQSEHPELRVTVPQGERLQLVKERLVSQGERFMGKLHVVDPMGSLMMRYPKQTPGKDMLMDLERLLKVSENWVADASH